MIAALILTVTMLQAPAQGPAADRLVGVWVVKSITINGRAVKDASEASRLLEPFGGVEIGATYRFRRGDQCVLNGVYAEYKYHAETRELVVFIEEKNADQIFDVRFFDKHIKLKFKKGGKAVEMVLTPEE